MYCVCNQDINKPFMIKERKRKNREHIKKREEVGNKRGGRKIKERKKTKSVLILVGKLSLNYFPNLFRHFSIHFIYNL
jgi:hypothetical protein